MPVLFSKPGDWEIKKVKFIAEALIIRYNLNKQSALALARLGKSAAHNYGLTEQQYGLVAGPAIVAAKQNINIQEDKYYYD